MNTNLDIVYNGEVQYKLNTHLIKRQKISDEKVEELKKLHVEKLDVFNEMRNTDNKEELKALAQKVEDIEFALQKTWGFAENRNFHEWYNVPKCRCPKMDNADNRGTEFRIYNESCPVHR